MKKFLSQTIRTIVLLDLCAAAVIGAITVFAGERIYTEFFRMVSCRTLGAAKGISFLVLVVAVSVAIELICRLVIQRPLLREQTPSRRALAVVLPALVFPLPVAFWGWAPASIAFLVGLAAAIQFVRQRQIWPMLVWHIQFTVSLVFLVVALAMLVNGEARKQYLWAYKLRNINDGALFYRENWGWVDESHYHKERLEMLLDQLKHAKEGEVVTVTICEPFVTVIKRWIPVEREYKIHSAHGLSKMDRWAVAAGISLDFSMESENAQGRVSPWLCSQMSAWQFDDVPSTLVVCFDHAPVTFPKGRELRDIPELRKRWMTEGDSCIREVTQDLVLPKRADPGYSSLLKHIRGAEVYWECTRKGNGE